MSSANCKKRKLSEKVETYDSHNLPPTTQELIVENGNETEEISDSIDIDINQDVDIHGNPPELVLNFPFKLDPFQLAGIHSLHKNENILVTAHTSAGKTVIAEYAIALALQNNQRVIYTSPIKALSNQKFREFGERFGQENIGLLTGDVSKRWNAPCVIMTTEILRNMLYKSTNSLREVAFVIFDEVHYMTDINRGVVWEESIILLDSKVTLIFLSATVSNGDDFALWIENLKHRKCRIISTDQRPIPLEHYVFPETGDSIFLVAQSDNEPISKETVDDENIKKQKFLFLSQNFKSAIAVFNKENKTKKQMFNLRSRNSGNISDLELLLSLLHNNHWLPIIVFLFSRADVEHQAMILSDNCNFNSERESKAIEEVFDNAIQQLTDADRNLSAIQSLLPLLKRGVGVHHSGILPILKEVTEILFQEGLIKVLFATETFAMGVNMPAKCVIFGQTSKYDGHENRNLTSGEYTQMSGRAGRRGIDSKGIVILMLKPDMNEDVCKQMMCGKPAALHSSFRLTYNMVLNLCRISSTSMMNTTTNCNLNGNEKIYSTIMDDNVNSDMNCQSIIEKSFYRFLITQRYPQIERRCQSLKSVIEEMEERSNFDDLHQYYNKWRNVEDMKKKAWEKMIKPKMLHKYLQSGRLVFIECENDVIFGWGIVIGFSKMYQPNIYFVDVMVVSDCVLDDTDSVVSIPLPAYGCKTMVNEKYSSADIGIVGDTLMSDLKDWKKNECPLDFYQLNGRLRKKCGLRIIRFANKCITKVSILRLNHRYSHLNEDQYLRFWEKMLRSLRTYHSHDSTSLKEMNDDLVVPCMNLFLDFSINAYDKKRNVEKWNKVQKILSSMKDSKYGQLMSDGCIEEQTMMNLFNAYLIAKKEYSVLMAKKKSDEGVSEFKDELHCKLKLLKKLEYINEHGILSQKGIVASFLEGSEEILLTELIFSGFFSDLDATECASLINAFCHGNNRKPKKGNDANANYVLPLKMHRHFTLLTQKAQEIIDIKKECGLSEKCGLFDVKGTEESYWESFRADLMPVVHAQCNQMAFGDVCKMTTMMEGNLIRMLKSLDDTLRQCCSAVGAIANDDLLIKFQDARQSLKHGIVFAASLYVEEEDAEESESEIENDREDDDDSDNENENISNTDIDIGEKYDS